MKIEQIIKENFDPSAEPSMQDEFIDIYNSQGEEALANALGLTPEQLEQEISEVAATQGLHADDDREEIIYRIIDDTVSNADINEAACPACAGRGHRPAAGGMDRPCDACDGTGKVEESATYIGNCTQDETVDDIFGDVSEFARQVELHGDEFEIDNLVVKYDPEEDIHHFYIKEDTISVEEGVGQWIAGAALLATLWGVNSNMANQSYENSPQLQKLISLHTTALENGDLRAVEEYEKRIQNHKTRLDIGKGEVMGPDGRAIEVKPFEESYDEDDAFFEAYGWLEETLEEAEYQGRKVKLNKPMQGDVKKFKVYVKDPKTGNVKKVNFGHGGSSVKGKAMRIRKSNPKARKSFRARHNCDNPGPKTKARYWSCRKW